MRWPLQDRLGGLDKISLSFYAALKQFRQRSFFHQRLNEGAEEIPSDATRTHNDEPPLLGRLFKSHRQNIRANASSPSELLPEPEAPTTTTKAFPCPARLRSSLNFARLPFPAKMYRSMLDVEHFESAVGQIVPNYGRLSESPRISRICARK